MKSYREYLFEQAIGKEQIPNLMVPLGGFYVEPRINKLLGLTEAKGEQKRFITPAPVLFDRYDIVYLSQFPPSFWARALEYRYGDALFNAKRAQLEGKEIPRTAIVRFVEPSNNKYIAYNFEVQTFTEHLLNKLESPFRTEYIENLINDSEGKRELFNRIHGSDTEITNPYYDEDNERYAPEYAVYGFDLTPEGEYKDPQKGIRTQLGKNFIAPQKKHLGDSTIPDWLKAIASGFLLGNPFYYQKVIGKEDNHSFHKVSFGGAKAPEFFVDFRGVPQRRQDGIGGGIKLPVYTGSGITQHLYRLMKSVGMNEVPFDFNEDGSISFVAMDDKGRQIASNKTLNTFLPILLEGEMMRQADYKKVFGLDNDNRIQKLFQGKEIDLKKEPSVMLKMAMAYKRYGEDVVDTPVWQDLMGAYNEVRKEMDRYDWADFMHIWLNPSKLPVKGNNFKHYKKAVADIGANWSDEIIRRGALDISKNQPWCIPTDDPDVLKVVNQFLVGDGKMLSIIDTAFDRKIKQLSDENATHQINAMEQHKDAIETYARNRAMNCLGGFPLVKIYADLVNGKVRWDDIPWRNKWKDVDIAWSKQGEEITDEEEFIQNVKRQVHSFLTSQAKTVIDNVLQLDLGHGTRRRRASGTTNTKGAIGMDVSEMMADAAQGMDRIESLRTAARSDVTGKRGKGQRTAIRDVRIGAIYFAHHISNMTHIIQNINRYKEEAEGNIEKAVQLAAEGMSREAEESLEDGLSATIDAQSAAVSAEIIDQIMNGQQIDIEKAQVTAIQKMSHQDNKQYTVPQEGRTDAELLKVQQEINELLVNVSPQERKMFEMARKGQLSQDVIQRIINEYKDIVEEDAADGNEDALEKLKMLELLAQMTGVSFEAEDEEFASTQHQTVSTQAPNILQSYSRNPQAFFNALPKAVQTDRSFGANLIYGLELSANPEINKVFANYFMSNPEVWNTVRSSANTNVNSQKAIQALLQRDPSFRQLATRQQTENYQIVQSLLKRNTLKSWLNKKRS